MVIRLFIFFLCMAYENSKHSTKFVYTNMLIVLQTHTHTQCVVATSDALTSKYKPSPPPFFTSFLWYVLQPFAAPIWRALTVYGGRNLVVRFFHL